MMGVLEKIRERHSAEYRRWVVREKCRYGDDLAVSIYTDMGWILSSAETLQRELRAAKAHIKDLNKKHEGFRDLVAKERNETYARTLELGNDKRALEKKVKAQHRVHAELCQLAYNYLRRHGYLVEED